VQLVGAFGDHDEEEAARLQQEIVELEQEIRAGPALVSLKAAVGAAMAKRGVSYPATPRSPLGLVRSG
jgi:hypothetical protein